MVMRQWADCLTIDPPHGLGGQLTPMPDELDSSGIVQARAALGHFQRGDSVSSSARWHNGYSVSPSKLGPTALPVSSMLWAANPSIMAITGGILRRPGRSKLGWQCTSVQGPIGSWQTLRAQTISPPWSTRQCPAPGRRVWRSPAGAATISATGRSGRAGGLSPARCLQRAKNRCRDRTGRSLRLP